MTERASCERQEKGVLLCTEKGRERGDVRGADKGGERFGRCDSVERGTVREISKRERHVRDCVRAACKHGSTPSNNCLTLLLCSA